MSNSHVLNTFTFVLIKKASNLFGFWSLVKCFLRIGEGIECLDFSVDFLGFGARISFLGFKVEFSSLGVGMGVYF